MGRILGSYIVQSDQPTELVGADVRLAVWEDGGVEIMRAPYPGMMVVAHAMPTFAGEWEVLVWIVPADPAQFN